MKESAYAVYPNHQVRVALTQELEKHMAEMKENEWWIEDHYDNLSVVHAPTPWEAAEQWANNNKRMLEEARMLKEAITVQVGRPGSSVEVEVHLVLEPRFVAYSFVEEKPLHAVEANQ